MILIKCGSYNDGTFWGLVEGEVNREWIKQISGAIKSYPNYWNWTNDTRLERKDDGEWVDVKKVYDMYSSIPREALDWFASFLPRRTERIDEIRFIDTTKRIEFYNRDGQEIWLEQVGDRGEWWQLRMDQPSLFNYTRLIFEEEDNQGIYAVDPPGGPFISVGSEVGIGGPYIVGEIRNTSLGIFLLLKENKKV